MYKGSLEAYTHLTADPRISYFLDKVSKPIRNSVASVCKWAYRRASAHPAAAFLGATLGTGALASMLIANGVDNFANLDFSWVYSTKPVEASDCQDKVILVANKIWDNYKIGDEVRIGAFVKDDTVSLSIQLFEAGNGGDIVTGKLLGSAVVPKEEISQCYVPTQFIANIPPDTTSKYFEIRADAFHNLGGETHKDIIFSYIKLKASK